jgi:hypothetical protein
MVCFCQLRWLEDLFFLLYREWPKRHRSCLEWNRETILRLGLGLLWLILSLFHQRRYSKFLLGFRVRMKILIVEMILLLLLGRC